MWYLLSDVDIFEHNILPTAFIPEKAFVAYLNQYDKENIEYTLISVTSNEFHLHTLYEGRLSTRFLHILSFDFDFGKLEQ